MCEPLVTMGQLSRTLDPLGWTIPVLPGTKRPLKKFIPCEQKKFARLGARAVFVCPFLTEKSIFD